ncbi:MAG: hypothetical protein JW940_07730 [Polyangiaceae bacterium]|nr:hypothetical protein [Polyangiaceae bacterium]
MSLSETADVDVAEVAAGLNRSRSKKRILVLGAMAASFAALVFFMVFSFLNP